MKTLITLTPLLFCILAIGTFFLASSRGKDSQHKWTFDGSDTSTNQSLSTNHERTTRRKPQPSRPIKYESLAKLVDLEVPEHMRPEKRGKNDDNSVKQIGDWTWPGDGSPQSLAHHMATFHGSSTAGKSFSQLRSEHNAIHDQIGPVSFDQQGNAFGPSIGFARKPSGVNQHNSYSTFINPGPVYASGFGSGGATTFGNSNGKSPVSYGSAGSYLRGSRRGSGRVWSQRVRRPGMARRSFGSRGR